MNKRKSIGIVTKINVQGTNAMLGKKLEMKAIVSMLLLLFNDVEGNSFDFPLGAYYDSHNMKDITLKSIAIEGNFVKANVIKNENKHSIVYFESKWVEFKD